MEDNEKDEQMRFVERLRSKTEKKEQLHEKYNENLITETLVDRAKSESWNTIANPGGQHGPDIIAEKDDFIIIIEAKGERKNLSQSSGNSRIMAALGQIILRMKKEKPGFKYRYCVAFPDTIAFTKCEIPPKPRNLLEICVFYINCPTGEIKVLLPGNDIPVPLNSFGEVFTDSQE